MDGVTVADAQVAPAVEGVGVGIVLALGGRLCRGFDLVAPVVGLLLDHIAVPVAELHRIVTVDGGKFCGELRVTLAGAQLTPAVEAVGVGIVLGLGGGLLRGYDLVTPVIALGGQGGAIVILEGHGVIAVNGSELRLKGGISLAGPQVAPTLEGVGIGVVLGLDGHLLRGHDLVTPVIGLGGQGGAVVVLEGHGVVAVNGGILCLDGGISLALAQLAPACEGVGIGVVLGPGGNFLRGHDLVAPVAGLGGHHFLVPVDEGDGVVDVGLVVGGGVVHAALAGIGHALVPGLEGIGIGVVRRALGILRHHHGFAVLVLGRGQLVAVPVEETDGIDSGGQLVGGLVGLAALAGLAGLLIPALEGIAARLVGGAGGGLGDHHGITPVEGLGLAHRRAVPVDKFHGVFPVDGLEPSNKFGIPGTLAQLTPAGELVSIGVVLLLHRRALRGGDLCAIGEGLALKESAVGVQEANGVGPRTGGIGGGVGGAARALHHGLVPAVEGIGVLRVGLPLGIIGGRHHVAPVVGLALEPGAVVIHKGDGVVDVGFVVGGLVVHAALALLRHGLIPGLEGVGISIVSLPLGVLRHHHALAVLILGRGQHIAVPVQEADDVLGGVGGIGGGIGPAALAGLAWLLAPACEGVSGLLVGGTGGSLGNHHRITPVESLGLAHRRAVPVEEFDGILTVDRGKLRGDPGVALASAQIAPTIEGISIGVILGLHGGLFGGGDLCAPGKALGVEGAAVGVQEGDGVHPDGALIGGLVGGAARAGNHCLVPAFEGIGMLVVGLALRVGRSRHRIAPVVGLALELGAVVIHKGDGVVNVGRGVLRLVDGVALAGGRHALVPALELVGVGVVGLTGGGLGGHHAVAIGQLLGLKDAAIVVPELHRGQHHAHLALGRLAAVADGDGLGAGLGVVKAGGHVLGDGDGLGGLVAVGDLQLGLLPVQGIPLGQILPGRGIDQLQGLHRDGIPGQGAAIVLAHLFRPSTPVGIVVHRGGDAGEAVGGKGGRIAPEGDIFEPGAACEGPRAHGGHIGADVGLRGGAVTESMAAHGGDALLHPNGLGFRALGVPAAVRRLGELLHGAAACDGQRAVLHCACGGAGHSRHQQHREGRHRGKNAQ